MDREKRGTSYGLLALAVAVCLASPVAAADITTKDVTVKANRAKEEAKYESQSVTVVTSEDIEAKRAKSVEDIIFGETGVTRTVDAMGRVGISIRGADPRHTLILTDGQPVLGDVSKYLGGSDEAMRIGAENIERMEIIRGAAAAKYGPDAIGGVVNIITKKPSETASFSLSGEAMYHNHEGTDANNTWPSNFYFRADTGKVGNAKFSFFGSKRSVMPVYSSTLAYGGSGDQTGLWTSDFKPSLRYYGDVTNIGVTGEVELNQNNTLSFRVVHEKENMERRTKSETNPIGAIFEPMIIFGRDQERDTYGLTYTGKNARSDWTLDIAYGKRTGNDVTKNSYYGAGFTTYMGQNGLSAVDWLTHTQWDVKATVCTAVNDAHYLTYGAGYTKEKATGTRLKNAPKKWLASIDPWDFDKNLYTDATSGSNEPESSVHDYLFKREDDGSFNWNKNREYYNSESAPPITYEEMLEFSRTQLDYNGTMTSASGIYGYEGWLLPAGAYQEALQNTLQEGKITQAQYDRLKNSPADHDKFAELLKQENPDYDTHYKDIVDLYYGLDNYGSDTVPPVYNGARFKEMFDKRKNLVSGGEAELKREYAFLSDTWQVNKDTILMPVLRLDHSDLFGSHVTANLGMTRNLGGNAHRRFKVNVGTGYAEPGMGELYYNWEMYGSAGGGQYGWYWIGNPDLKPEKSFNMDLSLEGENKRTFARVSLFRNVIDDYMSGYFIGQLINFGSYITGQGMLSADRIYSFKNIGKAEITGVEAEVQQRFNEHWFAKLGYAYLHAINKSDPDMPRQLLDRPQHKIDISLNYEDKAHGWRAALWGDYYIHMLDSNSVSTVYSPDDYNAETGKWAKKKAEYKKKTFGLWNFLIEKEFGNNLTAYIGVDNIFNYRDDDRADQDRTYRIGASLKFDTGKGGDEKHSEKKYTFTVPTPDGKWFLDRPSDKDEGRKKGDVRIVGEYRTRSNMHGGYETAGVRELVTMTKHYKDNDPRQPYYTLTTGSNDDGAVRNITNAADHGWEQRIRLGVDAQIGKNTNLFLMGSTGMPDFTYTISDRKGLHDFYLEEAKINHKEKEWDFTAGRLKERMGATGYWFGQDYTGVRMVYTGHRTQVRAGYGDFGHSTGIVDSAYTHGEKGQFYRAPTYDELLGGGAYYFITKTYRSDPAGKEGEYVDNPDLPYQNYKAKFNHAGDGLTDPVAIADARRKVLAELNEIRKTLGKGMEPKGPDGGWRWYNEFYQHAKYAYSADRPNDSLVNKPEYGQTWTPEAGMNSHIPLFGKVSGIEGIIHLSNRNLNGEEHYDLGENAYVPDGSVGADFGNMTKLRKLGYDIHSVSWGDILDTDEKKAKEKIYDSLKSYTDAIRENYARHGKTVTFTDEKGNPLSEETLWDAMYVSFMMDYAEIDPGGMLYHPTEEQPIPLAELPKTLLTEGTLIRQDILPSVDRAAYIQLRHQVSGDLGLTAWYLRSSGDKFLVKDKELSVANVFGVGAKYRIGRSYLSFDWGVNRSDTGRYFHGGRDEYGKYIGGSAPSFRVIRLEVGETDTDVPGSWNAFADYKQFEHGSFLGGNGTDALPDRYLDGIRSFTVGGGYVPMKNLLLEVFYTFDARSTETRDTLYGSEHFRLGDYTRVQATYRF